MDAPHTEQYERYTLHEMNQYAMRSWRGWSYHTTLVMIAYLFLVTLQQEFRENVPALTVPQARMLLGSVLPRQVFDLMQH